MKFIQAIVASPIKVSVGVILLLMFGIVSLTRMPMQLTPEVQTPTITIATRWPGASPEEVEREIILEQEEYLKGVEGATKLTSESTASAGTIMLEFEVGTDMNKAVVDVIGRLEQVPEYPENADKPVIATANAADRPIAWFILSAKPPSDEQIVAMQKAHPQLKAPLQKVRDAHNPGLAMLRLRLLAKDHPVVKQLLPPDDLDVSKLRRFAEDEIESRFERVPGVSQANVLGGLEDELQVIIDPEALAARQLTIPDVRRVLRGQNADISAGEFWEDKRRWVTRVKGQFNSPEQVELQLLAVREGEPVFVRDVAEVKLGFKRPDGLVRRFGDSSIAINALRATGSNVMDVMAGLVDVNQQLNEGILQDNGLTLTHVYDETEYIESSVDLVRENIFVGGALTMIVLVAFLHLGARALVFIPLILISSLASVYLSSWWFLACLAFILAAGFWFARGALVVGLAILVSLVGTFLVLQALGRSLNVISLAGLAFAVGMLVDNFIVVMENIYRRISSLGEPPLTAAVRGTQEVWGAVLAATFANVAVFLPIVFVQEEAGQLFRDIALAISAALGLSLLIALTLIPTAAARLFNRGQGMSISEEDAPTRKDSLPLPSQNGESNGQQNGHANGQPAESNVLMPETRWRRFAARSESLAVRPVQRFGRWFVGSVLAINRWILASPWRGIAVVAVMTFTSIGLAWLLWPKVEYLPNGDRNLVFGILIPPPGYNLDELTKLGETVEQELRPYWDVDPDSEEAKKLDYPVIGDFFYVARGRQVFLGLRAHDERRASELVPLIHEVGSKLPGMIAIGSQASLFEQGLTAGRTVDIEITGPDLEKLVALGGQVFGTAPPFNGVLQKIPEAQSRPIPSLDLSSPELHIDPLPKLFQAAEMNVPTTDLGYSADALIDGAYAGDYYLGGDKIDLTIIGKDAEIARRTVEPAEKNAQRTQDVSALPIATPIGQLVPLGALAEVRLASGPEQINHRERQRAITIQVKPPPEMALEDAMLRIQEEIVAPLVASGQLEGGYRITLAGTADKLKLMQHTFIGQWTGWNLDSFISIGTSQFALVLIITYLMMAALFESWLYPLVVMFSVPLGAVGGVLGLQLLNLWVLQPLDVLTMLGFLILIGTVVNNPILIVHQALNHIREDGMTPREAVLESTRTRIRPIFMTTLMNLMGLLPLVLFPGAGSELYRGLGSVTLGGLLVSTIFTLVLVPTLFTLTMEARGRILGRLRPLRRAPANSVIEVA